MQKSDHVEWAKVHGVHAANTQQKRKKSFEEGSFLGAKKGA